ncbi:hypothetical protein M422DRAFT_263636 [Sphaerobolus stellatus SS14]|uniref:Uncharacterized protein n=1 Tax=Sphaerobolus stellatus (strain SS14) TaxID=990650 RepID=A0A0C9TVF3_SPHS4|nr:hypothetical protein M422DRAFT_263636 [Sphaerobolus stellatus SS14]
MSTNSPPRTPSAPRMGTIPLPSVANHFPVNIHRTPSSSVLPTPPGTPRSSKTAACYAINPPSRDPTSSNALGLKNVPPPRV